MNTIKITLKGILLASTLILTSCLGETNNEYYITSLAFATVTTDGAGNYRLYLDENRGILIPDDESTTVNWGDTKRALIHYDLPWLDSIRDNHAFRSRLRDAKRLSIASTVDVTGMSKMPESLGNKPVYDFALQAYWGYITLQAAPGNTNAFDMTCSYDRNRYYVDSERRIDTLFMQMHYKESSGSWNLDIPQTVCMEIPQFARDTIKSDSLYIAIDGNVWTDNTTKDTKQVRRGFKISRRRITAPTYTSY